MGSMPFARLNRSTRPDAVRSAVVRSVVVRSVVVLSALVLSVVVLASPGSAESPTVLAEDELVDDGVFVSPVRFGIDEEALIAAVGDVRDGGLDLVVVAPADPEPTAKAFARRLQEKTEADAALVFPLEGEVQAYVVEDLSTARPRALEAARSLADPARAVEVFAEELTIEHEPGRPAIIGQILRALLLLAVVIGAVIAAENLIARNRQASAAAPRSAG